MDIEIGMVFFSNEKYKNYTIINIYTEDDHECVVYMFMYKGKPVFSDSYSDKFYTEHMHKYKDNAIGQQIVIRDLFK